MKNLKLVQVTVGNGVFGKLRSQWGRQVLKHPKLAHSHNVDIQRIERIARENGNDPKYGVYAICEFTEEGEISHINACFCLNHKLQNTSAAEFRITDLRLAPRIRADQRKHRAEIVNTYTKLLYSGLDECARSKDVANPKSVETEKLRAHFPSDGDMRFAEVFESVFNSSKVDKWQVKLAGNWLLFTKTP